MRAGAFLVPSAQKKLNHARLNDPREAALAEPKGKAKTLRQKDRIRTGLRRVRLHRSDRKHTKGATALEQGGNLSGLDGGRKTSGVFLSIFLRKTGNSVYAEFQSPFRHPARGGRRMTPPPTGEARPFPFASSEN